MKTPRFFIAVAAFAFVLTIASSSIEPLLNSCSAENLPILRVDPRMGDPDQPGGGYHEIPFDHSYELAGAEVRSPAAYSSSRAAERYATGLWHRIWHLFLAHATGFGRGQL